MMIVGDHEQPKLWFGRNMKKGKEMYVKKKRKSGFMFTYYFLASARLCAFVPETVAYPTSSSS